MKKTVLIFIIALFTAAAATADTVTPLQFATRNYERTFSPDGSEAQTRDNFDTPYFSIELSFQEPQETRQSKAITGLRGFMLEQYFGRIPEGTVDEAFQDIVKESVTDWRENGLEILEDFPDAVSAAMWELYLGTSIDFNKSDIISFGINSYQFSGGAHGLGTSFYYNYDCKTAESITLSSLFKEPLGETLDGPVSRAITAAAKKKFEIPEYETLYDAGIWNEELYPTENFFITHEGITFFYNVYEIAPYVMGGIEVTVPYEDIRRFLVPGAPVFRLID